MREKSLKEKLRIALSERQPAAKRYGVDAKIFRALNRDQQGLITSLHRRLENLEPYIGDLEELGPSEIMARLARTDKHRQGLEVALHRTYLQARRASFRRVGLDVEDDPASEMWATALGRRQSALIDDNFDREMDEARLRAEKDAKDKGLEGKAALLAIGAALVLWYRSKRRRSANLTAVSEVTTGMMHSQQSLMAANPHMAARAQVVYRPDVASDPARDTLPICQSVLDANPHSVQSANSIGWGNFHKACPHVGFLVWVDASGERVHVNGKIYTLP